MFTCGSHKLYPVNYTHIQKTIHAHHARAHTEYTETEPRCDITLFSVSTTTEYTFTYMIHM